MIKCGHVYAAVLQRVYRIANYYLKISCNKKFSQLHAFNSGWNLKYGNSKLRSSQKSRLEQKKRKGEGASAVAPHSLFFAHYNDNEFEAVKHTHMHFFRCIMHHSECITVMLSLLTFADNTSSPRRQMQLLQRCKLLFLLQLGSHVLLQRWGFTSYPSHAA